jgi:AraC-like DNA-binding protein
VQDIPLVRAKYVHAFAAVLDRIGAPTNRLLKRVGLSGRVLDDCEAIMPAHQAWAFIGTAAEKQGIDDFGLQAGTASVEAYGEFSRQIGRAANLNRALELFCHLARHEYSRADFYVAREQGRVWFCRGPIDGSDVERKHVELLVLTMMISTVQLVAGRDWRPTEIAVQTRAPRGIESHEILSSSNVRFGSRITVFEIPTGLLFRQMPRIDLPSNSLPYDRLEYDLADSLRHVVSSQLSVGEPSITRIADAVGIGPRTLQRRLSRVGTTFSQLVEKVRMTSAMAMLLDGSMTVRDIALQLRYTDQGNFTRAFRRWTGVSPQTYRDEQMK